MNKNTNFDDSLKNAINGVCVAFKEESSIKIEMLIAFFVVIVSVIYKLNYIEYMMVFLSIGLVIVTEMINTSIESVVDLSVDKYSIKAKRAKDVGAGAVIISMITSFLVAVCIFFKEGIPVINEYIHSTNKNIMITVKFYIIVIPLILIFLRIILFFIRKVINKMK